MKMRAAQEREGERARERKNAPAVRSPDLQLLFSWFVVTPWGMGVILSFYSFRQEFNTKTRKATILPKAGQDP
jgi:hypothetical protein